MNAASATRVVVVGSLNMDLSVRVTRLPKPGETVTGQALERSAGGKGANQAVAAHRLGAHVTLVGMIGGDSFGSELAQRLADEGLDVTAIGRCAEAPTGVAMIAVDAAGENMIVLAPGANAQLRPTELGALRLDGADALLVQLEVPLATVRAAAEAARARGVPVIVNAAPLPAVVGPDLLHLLTLVDLLVVNETEAAGLTGLGPADPEATAKALLALGPVEVVLTLGERGALAAHADGSHRVPPFKVAAIDAVGAGDAFCAELTIARHRRADPDDLATATARACAAGALATTRPGAQGAAPSRSEVDRLLAEHLSVTSDAT